MKNTRLLKLVLLGGLVLGQAAFQQAWALDDMNFGSLSGHFNTSPSRTPRLDWVFLPSRTACPEHAATPGHGTVPARHKILAAFSDRVKKIFKRQGPVTEARSNVVHEDDPEEMFHSLPSVSDDDEHYSLAPEEMPSLELHSRLDWEMFGFGFGSNGKLLPFMNAAEIEETEAQYGRAVDIYNRQPGVIAARLGSGALHNGVKPFGQYIWASCVEANFPETAIGATLAAYNTPLMRGAAAGVSAIIGLANPGLGLGVNKVLQGGISAVQWLAPLDFGLKLALHNTVYKPVAPHVCVGVGSAGKKMQGLFEKLAAHFKNRPAPAAS